jgi:hypothetical protein
MDKRPEIPVYLQQLSDVFEQVLQMQNGNGMVKVAFIGRQEGMDGARGPIQQCIRRPREVECDNIDVGDHYVVHAQVGELRPTLHYLALDIVPVAHTLSLPHSAAVTPPT